MVYGGVESVVLNWVERLDRSRFDVHLVCFANPGQTEEPFVREARRRGFDVHTIPWSRRKPVWKAARALSRLLREHRASIVHSHNCYADCVAAVAGRLAGVRTITTVYVWADKGVKRRLIDAVQQCAIRTFDQVTVHCRDTFHKTVARRFPAEDLRTLICGFDLHPREMSPDERQARRLALGVGDEDVLFGNVARFFPEKKQEVLLDAMRLIVDAEPRARLAIVGVGPLEAELRARCEALGLTQHVQFLGWVEDVQDILPLVDIHLHPARIEGVSLAIGEAMAAGLPVVASAVGGLFEILEDDNTAVLIPPGPEEAERFAAAALRLVADPAEARRLGDNARRFILDHYSLSVAVRRVEAVYEELMARRPMAPGTGERVAC